MLDMAMNSAKLFFAGKLFQNRRDAIQKLLVGAAAGVVSGVVVGMVAPLWLAALVAGAVAGFAQPVLYKDLKYA